MFPPSELILNSDGSIYHLHLHPGQLADTIITVGDPDRVERVSRHFDRVDVRVNKREFVTHTGELNGQRLTVISTGIGTDNIDIVINELDALASINLTTRELLPEPRQLTIVRIGTSGALQADLGVDAFLASAGAIGMEGLLLFYERPDNAAEKALLSSLDTHLRSHKQELPLPAYWTRADDSLLDLFADYFHGHTITAGGFYAPQGRQLRLPSRMPPSTLDALAAWRGPGQERLTNLEMETAGIYGMATLLGHRAISLNALLANRPSGLFSSEPQQTVDRLIQDVLGRLTT